MVISPPRRAPRGHGRGNPCPSYVRLWMDLEDSPEEIRERNISAKPWRNTKKRENNSRGYQIRELLLMPNRVTACLAEGDGPGFGHLPDFRLPLLSFSRVWEYFCLPDFISDGLRTPSMAGYVTDRGYPVRGEAVLRVVVKDLCALVLWEGERCFWSFLNLSKTSLSRFNNELGKTNQEVLI
ncbi:hypothetical protein Acr_00g0101200 [Actinidia rufa]|uniref:Uncharacterized protein n=1 Tax=Actinidia rufa TaxID=165716 RepID=A0A7J0DZZ4_9ERIC|nr:hypothetical protein Acr_00g0101200 [Actinidia rufa]